MLFDSHCHLTDEAFRADLSGVLERARRAGVARIVCVASDPDDSVDALARVADGRWIWTTAGVHPHAAASADDGWLTRVRELTAEARVVALGECGLDFHYDHAPRDVQLRVFEAHVALAQETGLPVVVHARDADEDMTAVLRDVGAGVTGVLHCFTGGRALLDVALERGWYVSFTGMVTFRRFDGAELLGAVPEDRLMIETDAPYLAPVPHRGQRNEPAFVERVADAVARHRGEPGELVREHTTRNANRFYGLEA